MRQAATRELFDYWNRLRGERGAPERSEVDLAAISKLLADTFLLEIDVAHRFPFLMSGSRVNALFCAEQKSRSFLDLWSPRDAHNVAAVLLT
ncbi:MAG: PAS domain-containing protein, partial [Methylovirgula sp.]